MASMLPYTSDAALYDNAKFRHRSPLKKVVQAVRTSNVKKHCGSFGVGQLLGLLLFAGLVYLAFADSKQASSGHVRKVLSKLNGTLGSEVLSGFWSKRNPPDLRKPPDSVINSKGVDGDVGLVGIYNTTEDLLWKNRQVDVAQAFKHAWKGYKSYAMGYDELQPVSASGSNGLGGLGATVIDALDTAMIMGLGDIVQEAGSWIEEELSSRLSERGQVNLFETTIRVLGGLLSAYHLCGGGYGVSWGATGIAHHQGPKPEIYLERAKDLGDRLLAAFTSSPSPIPFSDVVLRERRAHAAGFGDGASSTSEVTTVQLEFLYLSEVTGDPKYRKAALAVYEHVRGLPKTEGLVPIFLSPHSGQFQGNNIRLGSRGDSYYEYLLKVWLQQGGAHSNNSHVAYLRDMYDEAMTGVKHLLLGKSEPNGLVFVGELPNGVVGGMHPKMDHLVCFLAGNLALGATKGISKQQAMAKGLLSANAIQDLNLAEDLARTCYEMYEVTATGLAPEIAYFNLNGKLNVEGGKPDAFFKHDIIIKPADRHNLLRPEMVESLFVLYRITGDLKYREWGWKIFQAFQTHTKVISGGYASLDDVTIVPAPKRDKMETFFVGETLKYLYLLFGDTNVLPLTHFVFNTEAHPLPIIWQDNGNRINTVSQDNTGKSNSS